MNSISMVMMYLKRSEPLHSPIFLVGCERSGTTMLRLMLNHHPQIAFHHEFDFVVTHLLPSGVPDIRRFHKLLYQDRIFVDSHFNIDEDLDYQGLVNSFLRQVMEREHKPMVGAKIHHAYDLLPDIWPDCRIIHIVRDPRDVARSIVKMGWEGNVWCAAQWWRKAEETWEHLRPKLSSDRFIVVHFEHLVENPKQELTRICQFLGVEFNQEMLSYDKSSSYEAPNASLANQWRGKLSRREIALVESQVGPILEEFEYVRVFDPPRMPSAFSKAILNIHSRIARLFFRVKTYGLGLTIQDAMFRRWGTEAMKSSVRERIWKVKRQNLK